MGRPLYFAAVVSIFFSSSFFLACSQSEIGCLPYFHTWCGLSANLECMSEMCCTRLAEIQDAKITQKSRHLRTIAQLCRAISLQLRHISTIGKSLLNSNISSTCPHNMVNVRPLTAEIGWRVWGTPANFNGFRVLASLLYQRRSTEVNQTLHDVWPSRGLLHYYGYCPITEFCQMQHSYCVQVLALLHNTRAVWVSQTLRRVTRKGIRELSLVPPPIFRRAAITLGIGPHSSLF